MTMAHQIPPEYLMSFGVQPGCERKRKPNFTEEEKLLLMQEYGKRKAVLRPRPSCPVTPEVRHQAWAEITHIINSQQGAVQRSLPEIQKKWQNMVTQMKDEVAKKLKDKESEASLEPVTRTSLSGISRQIHELLTNPEGEDNDIIIIKEEVDVDSFITSLDNSSSSSSTPAAVSATQNEAVEHPARGASVTPADDTCERPPSGEQPVLIKSQPMTSCITPLSPPLSASNETLDSNVSGSSPIIVGVTSLPRQQTAVKRRASVDEGCISMDFPDVTYQNSYHHQQPKRFARMQRNLSYTNGVNYVPPGTRVTSSHQTSGMNQNFRGMHVPINVRDSNLADATSLPKITMPQIMEDDTGQGSMEQLKLEVLHLKKMKYASEIQKLRAEREKLVSEKEMIELHKAKLLLENQKLSIQIQTMQK